MSVTRLDTLIFTLRLGVCVFAGARDARKRGQNFLIPK